MLSCIDQQAVDKKIKDVRKQHKNKNDRNIVVKLQIGDYNATELSISFKHPTLCSQKIPRLSPIYI